MLSKHWAQRFSAAHSGHSTLRRKHEANGRHHRWIRARSSRWHRGRNRWLRTWEITRRRQAMNDEPPAEFRDKIESTTAGVFIFVLGGVLAVCGVVAAVHSIFYLGGKL